MDELTKLAKTKRSARVRYEEHAKEKPRMAPGRGVCGLPKSCATNVSRVFHGLPNGRSSTPSEQPSGQHRPGQCQQARRIPRPPGQFRTFACMPEKVAPLAFSRPRVRSVAGKLIVERSTRNHRVPFIHFPRSIAQFFHTHTLCMLPPATPTKRSSDQTLIVLSRSRL